MPGGSSGVAAAMAVSTSTAAPSISRLRSNCSVIEVLPVRADRDHRIQAGDGGELPLERRRHGGRHGGRIGAGQAGATR